MGTDRDRRTVESYPVRAVEFHVLLTLAAGEGGDGGVLRARAAGAAHRSRAVAAAGIAPRQKLTFVLNVTRRNPDADVGWRKNGDVITPL